MYIIYTSLRWQNAISHITSKCNTKGKKQHIIQSRPQSIIHETSIGKKTTGSNSFELAYKSFSVIEILIFTLL